MEPISVIVIDDHPIVREGLVLMLQKEEDLCVVASSGKSKATYELLRIHRPDVLLIDIHLESTTFNIVKRSLALYPELRVLFITAFDTFDNIERVKLCGGHGLLSKIENLECVCHAIRKVSEGGTYFSDPTLVDGMSYRSPLRPKKLPEHHPLSPREVDVLCCVAQAMTAKEIAKNLHISVKTVDRHKANIMEKLHMRSQIELARYAIRHGFVEA